VTSPLPRCFEKEKRKEKAFEEFCFFVCLKANDNSNAGISQFGATFLMPSSSFDKTTLEEMLGEERTKGINQGTWSCSHP
jgi:hypothetical protein